MDNIDVLIVEDEQNDQLFIQRALNKHAEGTSVKFVPSAEDALEYLEHNAAPALIVTDLTMPGMGGHQLVSKLKADDRHRRTPIIVLSTSSDNQDINDAYDNHANSYLVKPRDLSGYMNIVTTLRDFWFKTASLPQRQT